MRRHWEIVAALMVLLMTPSARILAQGDPFIRGDVDENGVVNVGDAIFLTGFVFFGPVQTLECQDAASVSDESSLTVVDVINLLSFLIDDLTMPAPYPACGLDPTEDDWESCVYDAARCDSPLFAEECNPNIGISLEADPPSGGPGTYTRLKVRLDLDREGLEDLEIAGWNYSICLDEGLTPIGSDEEPAYASFTTAFGGFADYRFIAFAGADDPAFDDIEEFLREAAMEPRP